MGSNNFLQWNPSQINQESDATYSTEVMRTGGAISGIYPSEIANKLYYQCSTMVAAIGQMMANKGYTISDADIAVLITALANILTKADFGTGAGTVCQGNDGRLNISGMKVWFYLNVAPTGWTIDTSAADTILAVKGGANAYNVAGGNQAGTWTQPGHILTKDELASHGHGNLYAYMNGTPSYGVGGGVQSVCAAVGGGDSTLMNASVTGSISGSAGDQSHNHGTTWRPLANVGIICTKS